MTRSRANVVAKIDELHAVSVAVAYPVSSVSVCVVVSANVSVSSAVYPAQIAARSSHFKENRATLTNPRAARCQSISTFAYPYLYVAACLLTLSLARSRSLACLCLCVSM